MAQLSRGFAGLDQRTVNVRKHAGILPHGLRQGVARQQFGTHAGQDMADRFFLALFNQCIEGLFQRQAGFKQGGQLPCEHAELRRGNAATHAPAVAGAAVQAILRDGFNTDHHQPQLAHACACLA